MRLPETPPDSAEILQRINPEDFPRIALRASPLPGGRYLHWDELRYREPPEGLTREWQMVLGVAVIVINVAAYAAIHLAGRRREPGI